jgi:HEAT repeat protein
MNGLDLSIKILGESASERALDTLMDGLANEPLACVRSKVFDCLLSQKWDEAAGKIIVHYSRLDSAQKCKVLERHDSLLPHLRSILDLGAYDAKCNAIQIINDLGKTKLLYMLVPVFSGIDERLRRRAGDALLKTVQNYIELKTRLTPDDTSALADAAGRSRDDALAVFTELFRSYGNHCEQNVLRAMLMLGDECHTLLMTAFEPGNERAAADLVRMLSVGIDKNWESLVARMYLSKNESIRRKADAIIKKRGQKSLPPVLRNILLIAEPKAVVELAEWWGAPTWWKLVTEIGDDVEVFIQDKLIAVIRDPRTDTEKVLPCLEKLAHSKSARIRRLALEELTFRRKADAELLQSFLRDTDEEVQLQSTRALLHCNDPKKEELVIRQLLSQHAAVRKVAAEEVARFSFSAYMRAFDSLGNKTRMLAAAAISKLGGAPEKEVTKLLAAAETDTKIKALRIIALAGADQQVEPQVIALTVHPNSYLRATAVLALAVFPSAAAEQAIIKALRDSDDRVIANAIEALELRGDPACVPLAKQFMRHHTARVRANVVKLLYRFGDKAYRDIFLGMCKHFDRRMRSSAIWLAEHLRMPEAAEGLARIARSQTERKIRQKAANALETMAGGDQTQTALKEP